MESVPLIGPESTICTRQGVFQLGAQLIQFDGESSEAVVQLVVCRHGAWEGGQVKTRLLVAFYSVCEEILCTVPGLQTHLADGGTPQ